MAEKQGSPSKPTYSGGAAHYNLGPHTLSIPMTLHSENRTKLLKRLEGRFPERSFLVLQGAVDSPRGSSDVDYAFRQESYFHWAFGVLEPGWFGVIEAGTGRTILFCPRLPQTYAVWMGAIRTPEEYRQQYAVDEVRYVDEIAQYLKENNAGTLLTLRGVNSDSGHTTGEATFDGIGRFNVDNELLFPEMADCRVCKSPAEIEVLRFSAKISSQAHKAVMRRIRPGMKEYQLEALFQYNCYYHGGCRNFSYTCICATGSKNAVLHYGHAGEPNSQTIRDGAMCLFDMGCEYYCYTSDITCSFPANGKFTEDQKMIYNAVLAAVNAVHVALRPGVSWVSMHELAYRTMLTRLRDGGLLQGDVEDMMKANIGGVLQPTGLGHLMGLDVHDVGGYLEDNPSRPVEAGYRNLRTARVLQEGMVLTIEPGCYFIDYLLEDALANPEQARFFVPEVLQRFRNFGGVRIEDDILVTADGMEDLTQVPRTVEEIEAHMAAGREEEDVSFPQQHLQEKLGLD